MNKLNPKLIPKNKENKCLRGEKKSNAIDILF